jgi:hypothetical protein
MNDKNLPKRWFAKSYPNLECRYNLIQKLHFMKIVLEIYTHRYMEEHTKLIQNRLLLQNIKITYIHNVMPVK